MANTMNGDSPNSELRACTFIKIFFRTVVRLTMAANNNNQLRQLDAEHQLPAPPIGSSKQTQQTTEQQTEESSAENKFNAERGTLLDRVAHLESELQNSRKRATRDRQEVGEFVLADTLKSLLPIVDSLDRAVPAPVQSVEELRRGVELIRRQLEDTLRRLGVSPISATGQTFDPRVHEAVDVIETELKEDNQIVEELLPGYRLRDRLLRPAMVRVARNPKQDSQTQAAA
jgi:molecular chaperone GrpE